jgi:hypothetical protein
MRTFKTVLGFLLATQALLACPALHAQSASASFGVTIVLNTFSEAVTADHRCTHRGRADGPKETLRISCPATVDVQAIASASNGKTGQPQRLNALAVVAGKPMRSTEPLELTISW